MLEREWTLETHMQRPTLILSLFPSLLPSPSFSTACSFALKTLQIVENYKRFLKYLHILRILNDLAIWSLPCVNTVVV